MKILKQLRRILLSHGVSLESTKRSIYKPRSTNHSTLLVQAIDILNAGSISTDEQLAVALYGPTGKPSDNAYRKIKQRLIDHLATRIIELGIDANNLSSGQRGYYAAHWEYIVASILVGRSVYSSAEYFYKRSYQKALKYGAHHIIHLSLSALRNLAGAQDKNLKKFEKYDRLYQKSKRDIEAYDLVRKYYYRSVILYDASPRTLRIMNYQGKQWLKELDEKYNIDDYGVQYAYAYYSLAVLTYYVVSEYKLALTVSNQAVNYFSNIDVHYPSQLLIFYAHSCIFNTLLKNFKAAESCYESGLGLANMANQRVTTLFEAGFKMFMYSSRFSYAINLCEQVTRGQQFVSLPQTKQERWLINQAYARYAIEVSGGGTSTMTPFRLAKFINSLPTSGKQKAGNNIPIVIIHILFLILQKKFEWADQRIENAQKYLTRYLRQKDNYRSKCFFKILQKAAKVGFNPKRTVRSAQVWHEKLVATPLDVAYQGYEIEVIPYETLYLLFLRLPLPE